MQELRLAVADARSALRTAKDNHELAKAEAEQRAIDSGVNGKNETERTRNLTLALAQDRLYQEAHLQLRQWEAEVERREALLEAACDDRRNTEWQIRARLADALFRAGVQTDHADATGDGAFDDTADEWIFASERRRDLLVGQTADDVAWQQHMGTYDNGAAVEDDMPF